MIERSLASISVQPGSSSTYLVFCCSSEFLPYLFDLITVITLFTFDPLSTEC